MDIRSSKGVGITVPSIKFTGHSHTPKRRCPDSCWSFGQVMNNLLLDIPHVRQTLGMTVLEETKTYQDLTPSSKAVGLVVYDPP